jgi:hypothetical protein
MLIEKLSGIRADEMDEFKASTKRILASMF